MKPDIPDLLAAALDSDPNRKVSDVLRCALVVAANRNEEEFYQWAHQELNGYQVSPVHPHRMVRGRLYSGTPQAPNTVTFIGDTFGLREVLSTRHFPNPIGEIEFFVENPKLSTMLIDLPQDLVNELPLAKDTFVGEPRMFLEVPKPAFISVLEKVHTEVLIRAQAICGSASKPPPPFANRGSINQLIMQDSVVYGNVQVGSGTQVQASSGAQVQVGSGNQIRVDNSGIPPETLLKLAEMFREVTGSDPKSPKSLKWLRWLQDNRDNLGSAYLIIRKIVKMSLGWDLPL